MSFRSSAAALVATSEVKRTWWACELVEDGGYHGSFHEVRSRVDDEQEAILVASLTENGLHAPALDFDFPVEVEPLDYGHARLVLRCGPVRPRPWEKLIALMAACGLLRRGFERDESAWTAPSDPEALAIELAVPVRVVPSSTPGHAHVYLDVEMPWKSYLRVCKAMVKVGLLERGYLAVSKRRGMTMLFKPGLTKAQLVADGRMPGTLVQRKVGDAAGWLDGY